MKKYDVASNATEKNIRPHIVNFPLIVIFSLLLLMAQVCRAAEVTINWDPNPEPSLAGYRVYYGTFTSYYDNVIDVGNRTSCAITGLAPGVTYFIAATAYSSTGDESFFSGEISYTASGASASSSQTSGGGGCFIATAAYGTELSREVTILRTFRDRVLLTNKMGQAFVDGYYRVSPPIAVIVAEHEWLKRAVRWGLTPFVYAVKYPLASLAFVVLIPALALLRKRRTAVDSDRQQGC
jgi:hypothetical protein